MKWIAPLARHPRAMMALALSVVAIAGMGVFLKQRLEILQRGADWVVHSQNLRFELAQTLQALYDLTSGVNVFQLNHDPQVFEAADLAEAQLPLHLQSLEALVGDNHVQRPLLDAVVIVANHRLAQARMLRERARADDLEAVQNSVSQSEGRNLMTAARALLGQLGNLEQQALGEHRKASAASYRAAVWTIAGAGLGAIFLLFAITLATVRDSERLRLVQDELAAAQRQADKRKDEFLATLSHELRNPLAPIRSVTRQLLSAPGDSAQRTRSLMILSRQVDHMASLLDDLLDVARITRGALRLKPEETSLRSLIETAVESIRPTLNEHGHQLIVEYPKEELTIRADPVRLTQVITNLLGNAVKYTHERGHITLANHLDEASLRISVRDDGVGISAGSLAQIFDMFERDQAVVDGSATGLGIGLGLAKKLVELHGGHIEVASEGTGRGSDFTIVLPADLVSAGVEQPSIAHAAVMAPAASRKVLIVDDNRDAAESLGMLLQLSGHTVHMAHNGKEAVEAAEDQRPAIILMDIGMPVMNGYEAAVEIRKRSWEIRPLLIAVTGWGQADDKRKAADAGFDHHLTKPVDIDMLERLLGMGLTPAE
jgi:signal transduction histidine kinase/ActR/RegA family two-component response regulator